MLDGKGMQMMLTSVLKGIGVDKTKVETALDTATTTVESVNKRIASIESKIDLLLSRTEPRDAETAVAYIDDGNGGLTTVEAAPHHILQA